MHARAGHVNLSLLAGSLALAVVAAQPVSGSAAPAVITGGDADVIAHGVHEFVPGEYHWIVGAATLDDGASAPISTGGLTLLVQNDGVVDATSGDDSERLEEGSASLLRPDAESVVNATSGPSAYWTLSILNVEITGEMNATQFTLDQNLYNVKLYRTVAHPGDSPIVADQELPVFVFATDGTINLAATDSDPVELPAGQGRFLDGELVISNTSDAEAVFVAAVIEPLSSEGAATSQPDDNSTATTATDPAPPTAPPSETDPAAHQPAAVDDHFSTDRIDRSEGVSGNLLANDDLGSPAASLQSVDGFPLGVLMHVGFGTVMFNADGSFVATPGQSGWGIGPLVHRTYTISSSAGTSSATVNIYMAHPPETGEPEFPQLTAPVNPPPEPQPVSTSTTTPPTTDTSTSTSTTVP